MRGVGRLNEGRYAPELIRQCTAEQLARVYALNPVWAGIERRVYGALPID